MLAELLTHVCCVSPAAGVRGDVREVRDESRDTDLLAVETRSFHEAELAIGLHKRLFGDADAVEHFLVRDVLCPTHVGTKRGPR